MGKDEEKQVLKRKVMGITRRDFISAPYKDCPNCKRTGVFGVFMPIEGSRAYSRECIECWHEESYQYPKIKKRVVYLDQFVISNLIKLLDKEHPSHSTIKADTFWENLFIKLERATRAQAIVCPDSFYHRDESLVGNVNHRLMRRLYEHFSSGKTLQPSSVVERFQISKHFESWLKAEKTNFTFDPQDISFDHDLHTWSMGMRVSVGGNPYPGQIESLQEINSSTKNRLEVIWKRWQEEKHVNFESRVKEETSGLGRGLVQAAQNFAIRRNSAVARVAAGEPYEMQLEDFLPPTSNEILESLTRLCRVNNIEEARIPETVMRYFSDLDALLEIPAVRISSVLFAGWAHRAAMGKKEAPKSSTDVQFISSYLPYCDALFVDKESEQLLKEFPKNTPNHLRLKEFSAKVFSLRNKEQFLEYLDSVVNEIPNEQLEIVKDVSGEDYGKPYWEIIEYEKREFR